MSEKPDPYADIQHLLRWLYLALFIAGACFTINATLAAVEGRWVGMSLSIAGVIGANVTAIRTVRRAGRYKEIR